MCFESYAEACAYRDENAACIDALILEAESIEGVAYAELWLNGIGPSFVLACDQEDIPFASFPIGNS